MIPKVEFLQKLSSVEDIEGLGDVKSHFLASCRNNLFWI